MLWRLCVECSSGGHVIELDVVCWRLRHHLENRNPPPHTLTLIASLFNALHVLLHAYVLHLSLWCLLLHWTVIYSYINFLQYNVYKIRPQNLITAYVRKLNTDVHLVDNNCSHMGNIKSMGSYFPCGEKKKKKQPMIDAVSQGRGSACKTHDFVFTSVPRVWWISLRKIFWSFIWAILCELWPCS